MVTKILKICDKSIEEGANLLKNGEVVAFPTETVYGLGVSAFKGECVKKVFEVKGRPSDNPLIVHIAKIEDIYTVSKNVTPLSLKLLENFAPGPITVVVEKSDIIPLEVTAGLDTVGVRIPALKSSRDLIEKAGLPLAAPSANTSTRPSPTKAIDVFEDLNGKIPLILDGGEAEVGIESTVVDCRFDTPVILREGKITLDDIVKVCGCCERIGKQNNEKVARSPGVKYKHYAPTCPVYFLNEEEKLIEAVIALKKKFSKVGVVSPISHLDLDVIQIDIGNSTTSYMHDYFSVLRKLEKQVEVILVHLPFEKLRSEGIYNRVEKSAVKFDLNNF